MTNCPPVYRNLQCESFSNKRKITSQMLRQMCKNDAYLYEQIMELWDATDPESRKRFYPPDFMDVSHSFGIESYILTQEYERRDYNYWSQVYRFSNTRKWKYIFDFDGGNDRIVEFNSGGERLSESSNGQTLQYALIYADSYLDIENSHNEQLLEIVNENGLTTLRPPISTSTYEEIIHHNAEYSTKKATGDKYVTKDEKLGKAKKDASYKGAFNNWHCNNHWYNGFNRTKNYNVKSKWKKDLDSYDIPSVCHAQTFKAENSGRLSKVNLNVQGSKSAVSPCIVEIRETTAKGYPSKTVLARTEKKFSGTGNNIVAFEFKSKAKVTKGKTYAIVVRSPLSHFENTYRLGGWTTGCFSSEKKYYGNGSAFTSEDNGKTWKKNGKTKDTKSYGSHYYDWGINQKPIDFAFEVFVQPITQKAVKQKVKSSNAESLIKQGYTLQKDGTYKKLVKSAYDEKHTYEYSYIKEGKYYLHLKPIQINPIENFIISSTFTDDLHSNQWWRWEYFDIGIGEWVEVPNEGVDFNNNIVNTTILKLRIRCDIEQNTYVDTTSTISDSALNTLISESKLARTTLTYMKSAMITVYTFLPTKAYLRTLYYQPPQNQILGANIWSEIGINAQPKGNAKVEVDVIHEKLASEHFKFYDLNILNNVDEDNLTLQQIELIDDMNYFINYYNEKDNTNNYSSYDAPQILNYVVDDLEDEGLFISFLKSQVTPIYLLPLYYNNSTTPLVFFDKLSLGNIPSYPLNACEVGDDDIVIDISNFKGLSASGFYYALDKDISKTISSIDVTYTTSLDIDFDVTDDDVVDENGFEINDIDLEEQIGESLKGIFVDKTIGDCLTSGIVKDDVFLVDVKNEEADWEMVGDGETGTYTSVDYAITKDGKHIIFSKKSKLIQTLFPSMNSLPLTPTTTLETNTTISDFELKVNLTEKSYQEFVDFEVDYDNGTIEFYNQLKLIHGDFNITYNPLWVRGLSVADFPLKMDLWKEQYQVAEDGIYKIKYDVGYNEPVKGTFFDKTIINPVTNRRDSMDTPFYTFKTTVSPRDNIRKLVINEGTTSENALEEDSQFFVDYLANRVTLYTEVNVDDIITIHYTPNLTDNGLALAYRLERDDVINDDVYIGMNYFTYRT